MPYEDFAGHPGNKKRGWAMVCSEYHDIRVDAEDHLLGERFRALDDSRHDAERLEEWLALREELNRRMAAEEGHGKYPYREDVSKAMDLGGIGSEVSPDYVCPDGRCARLEPPMADEGPPCYILGRNMIRPAG